MVRSSESLTSSGQIKKKNIWFAGKYCQNLLEHVTKRAGPDILALQVQTVQPELVGVNLVCPWDWRSIILPNEQFVSYYGIRHIIA